MPTDDLPLIDEARLATAPPGTTLRFTIPNNGGYLTEATLFLGTRFVSSWQSSEILGKTKEEELTPTGLYTLMIDVIFNEGEKADVTMEFSSLKIDGGDEEELDRDTTSFSGKLPQIGRSLTMIRIEEP